MLTRLPLPRYSAALSATLPQKVHWIEVASSSPSFLTLEMATAVPLLMRPSLPWTTSSLTPAARRAFLCSTLTYAMVCSFKQKAAEPCPLHGPFDPPSAWDSSFPPTGGRRVGTAPYFTGRGWGWVVFSRAAEAVRRFFRPTACLDPPTS